MNFYLILPDFTFDCSSNKFVPNQKCHCLHVYQSPDKKSYNIYEPRVGPHSDWEHIWKWPRKRINRGFIEKIFKYQIFGGTIKGRNVKELLGNVSSYYLYHSYRIIE